MVRDTVADQAMTEQRIRHLPVIDESGKVCGILSQRDLFRGALLKALGYGDLLENKMLDTVLVKEAMVTSPVTTTPGAPITQAAHLMIENIIGCLLVVSNGELQGILTEGDFVQRVAQGISE